MSKKNITNCLISLLLGIGTFLIILGIIIKSVNASLLTSFFLMASFVLYVASVFYGATGMMQIGEEAEQDKIQISFNRQAWCMLIASSILLISFFR